MMADVHAPTMGTNAISMTSAPMDSAWGKRKQAAFPPFLANSGAFHDCGKRQANISLPARYP